MANAGESGPSLNGEGSNGPPLMTPLQIAVTFGAIAFPTAVLAAKYLFAKKDEISNEMLLGEGGIYLRNLRAPM